MLKTLQGLLAGLVFAGLGAAIWAAPHNSSGPHYDSPGGGPLEGTATGDIDLNGNNLIDSSGTTDIGTACTPVSAGAGDVCTGADLEVNGTIYGGAAINSGTNFSAPSNSGLILAGGGNGILRMASGQTSQAFQIGVGGTSRILLIQEYADRNTDMTHASQTNPTIFLHSADATDTGDWLSLTHNQTDAVIDVGNGDIKLNTEVEAAGVSGDGSGKIVCVNASGNLGTCSDDPSSADGTCTCS